MVVSNLNKRLSQLNSATADESTGVFGFGRLLFIFLLTFFVVGWLFSYSKDETYLTRQHKTADYRAFWLDISLVGGLFSDDYREVGKASVEKALKAEEENRDPSFIDMALDMTSIFSGTLYKILFVFIIFFPFWIIGGLAGYFYLKRNFINTPGSSGILQVLGIENRPFNSGINAPLKPNGSISCTDISCPGLACPPMAGEAETQAIPLAGQLRKFGALNQTNLSLLRIILAHQDYPCSVPPERSVDDQQNLVEEEGEGSFVSNNEGTLLESTGRSLPALLMVHSCIRKYFKSESIPKKGLLPYKKVTDDFAVIGQKLSTEAQTLLKCLTPVRARAIAHLPPTLVATGYLACEAGKCLVFDKVDDDFTRKSLYPHLQARAVLHSIESYHKEYKGDGKLIVRQAIICSRRHGDFGRAFLPVNMPIQSRALRDWLEVLFMDRSEQPKIAELCELDAHLEELYLNLKSRLHEKVTNRAEDEDHSEAFMWQGVVSKSVILMPLKSLIEICFYQVEAAQRNRIIELMRTTKDILVNLSISSRLPGFKRQAIEAAKLGDDYKETLGKFGSSGEKLLSQWLVLRRMLTRYNWLSTRIGDNPVPPEGFVRTILLDRSKQGEDAIITVENSIPLRQRRFKELIGETFEKDYYHCRIYRKDIFPYPTDNEFEEGLKKFKQLASEGKLHKPDTGEAAA